MSNKIRIWNLWAKWTLFDFIWKSYIVSFMLISLSLSVSHSMLFSLVLPSFFHFSISDFYILNMKEMHLNHIFRTFTRYLLLLLVLKKWTDKGILFFFSLFYENWFLLFVNYDFIPRKTNMFKVFFVWFSSQRWMLNIYMASIMIFEATMQNLWTILTMIMSVWVLFFLYLKKKKME